MKIKDREFEVFITEAELGAIGRRVAAEVSRDYEGKDLVACPILTGAYMFASDMLRQLTIPCEVRFVRYTSYSGMHSTGTVVRMMVEYLMVSAKSSTRSVSLPEELSRLELAIRMERMIF